MPQKSGSGEVTEVDHDRDAGIREIFLRSSKRYSYAEAERLTGIPAGALRRVHEDFAGPASSIPRADLLEYALTSVWSTEDVENALGRHASELLPPLRRTRSVTSRLPEYALRYIEADLGHLRLFPDVRGRVTIGAWIERIIADAIATADDERDVRRLLGPEWLRAFRWPAEA